MPAALIPQEFAQQQQRWHLARPPRAESRAHRIAHRAAPQTNFLDKPFCYWSTHQRKRLALLRANLESS